MKPHMAPGAFGVDAGLRRGQGWGLVKGDVGLGLRGLIFVRLERDLMPRCLSPEERTVGSAVRFVPCQDDNGARPARH